METPRLTPLVDLIAREPAPAQWAITRKYQLIVAAGLGIAPREAGILVEHSYCRDGVPLSIGRAERAERAAQS